ncbi:MAG: PQQ-dependent sugar dehydrogenase [Betaproteobacteria bacterium]|nr:PQQ-dependent sugar dehydrogenase [Betaproteobacteria bacterium]
MRRVPSRLLRSQGKITMTTTPSPRSIVCALAACLCVLAVARAPLYAQVITTDEHAVRVVTLVKGLDHPWGMAFLPDGRMLVTERPGRLRIVHDGRLDPAPVTGLPEIAAYGQGGLLDVATHPRFAENGLVYLAYAARGAGGVGTEVARGRLDGNRLARVEVIFRQQPKGTTGRHFGSRLVFDGAGYLYITLGDRGEMERAQRPDDHAGSVIRLHDDGRVPADNPFAGKPGWKPEKYTLGNRNMQGAALHPQTGMLWTHEHGPQGGDEVNVMRAGVNYGWPVITYGVNYGFGTRIGEGTHKAGMAQPLHYWAPSIAPSGMAFYTGDKFPRWRGDLLVGAQRDGEKVVKEERMLKDRLGRIRDVRVGPDGYVYLLTDESNGVLARLEPAS